MEPNNFESTIIKDWNDDNWKEFYNFLKSESELKIPDEQWKNWYIHNESGGFLGIFWHILKWKDYNVFLQIEQGNLCCKIGPVEVIEDRSNIRDEWHDILKEEAKKQNKNEIIKPAKFGWGDFMTVAIVERKNWLGNDNEIIQKEKVI